jgi:hypothetical protein
MTAYEKSREIARRLSIPIEAASTLRRAELVLHRWSEQECGDGNDYASWAIERDETTGKPFRATYPHRGESYRVAIADREAGALRRVRQVCEAHGLHYYHQGDPRGCALYVAREPLNDTNYTSGTAVCV